MDNKYQPATFWKRTMAFIFDLLVINIIIIWPFQSTFAKYLTNISTSNLFASESLIPGNLYLVVFIVSILALLYFTFFDYYLNQTLGQMLMNIEVISLKSDLTFWNALLRNCFILPYFPFYIFWIVEPLYLAFYKERFLEKITNTKTVIVGGKNYYEGYKLQKV